ncbi:MAG: hypothetical protein OEW19_20355, partial [Acidobacteriota bacterium]|nr:hypothetical protein [Acidobacteriota bacterium]
MSRRTGGPVHLLARLLHADHPVDRLIAEVCGGRALERQGAVVPLATPAPAARRARLWVSVAAAAVLLLVAVAARQGLPARETEDGGAETATPDADARLAYLGGRAAFAQGYSDTANQARARADLERAVTRDPGFAAAWAALARVDSAQYRTGMDRDAATLDAAERAARTAVGLDPRLPDGHLALAEIAFSRRDHGRAGRALELIAAMDAPGAWLSPNFRFPAAIAAGDVLDSLGRHEEARSRYVEA